MRARRRPSSDSSADVARRVRTPEVADPRWGIHERGIPGWVAARPDRRPRERRRNQQEAASCQLDVGGRLAVLPYAQRACLPADARVQVTERGLGPIVRERPRACRDLGLQCRGDRGPPGRQCDVPKRPHLRHQRVAGAVRLVDKALHGDRNAGRVRAGELEPNLPGRRRRDARQLGVDVRPRSVRWQADEHGPGRGPVRRRGVEQREVELRDAGASPVDPRSVDGVPLRVPERVYRADQLDQRRDREPGSQEVVCPEVVPDHGFRLGRISWVVRPRSS